MHGRNREGKETKNLNVVDVLREQEARTGSAQRGGKGRHKGEWGGGIRGRRINMVQIMYIHVSKCKNDTCWNCSWNEGQGMKESSRGGEFKYDILDTF
jgi:hypothetical protein